MRTQSAELRIRRRRVGRLAPTDVGGDQVGLGAPPRIATSRKEDGPALTGIAETRTHASTTAASGQAPFGRRTGGRGFELLAGREAVLAMDGRRVVCAVDISPWEPSGPARVVAWPSAPDDPQCAKALSLAPRGVEERR